MVTQPCFGYLLCTPFVWITIKFKGCYQTVVDRLQGMPLIKLASLFTNISISFHKDYKLAFLAFPTQGRLFWLHSDDMQKRVIKLKSSSIDFQENLFGSIPLIADATGMWLQLVFEQFQNMKPHSYNSLAYWPFAWPSKSLCIKLTIPPHNIHIHKPSDFLPLHKMISYFQKSTPIHCFLTNFTSLYLEIPSKHGPWLPDTLLRPVHQQCSTPATEELQPQLGVLTAAYNLLKVLETVMEGLWDEGLLQVERLLTLKGHLCYDTQHTNTDLYKWKEATN